MRHLRDDIAVKIKQIIVGSWMQIARAAQGFAGDVSRCFIVTISNGSCGMLCSCASLRE